MRHTRAHTGNRRAHHALEEPRLSRCMNCGELHVRHTMCEACGSYRGRTVVDMSSKLAKKAKKREERQKQAQ